MSPAVVRKLISTNPETNSNTGFFILRKAYINSDNEKVNNKKVATTIKYEENKCIETIRPIYVLQTSDRTQRKKSVLRDHLLIQ